MGKQGCMILERIADYCTGSNVITRQATSFVYTADCCCNIVGGFWPV